MNTRVFKDISKYQHRAWLGFTTRQIIFVLPAFIVTIIVLGLNLFFWQFGDWFVYGFVFAFTIPLLLFGVYKPNDLNFEHYLKYRLHFELTIPLRTISGKKGLEHEKKIKQAYKSKKVSRKAKALVRPERVITRVSTALDALNSSLSDGRGVDIDYMVSIYPEHSQAAILDELGDQILMDPESYLRGERKYLSKNQFLSGDILNKIEVVQLLVEENNQECDWSHAFDAIVIGDSQFEKIPVSKERQMNYIEDKLNELREIKTHSENKYTVKEAEQSISGLEKQLEELQRFNRDSFIDFENLGIDFLFVDEAHHFKNIRPITGLGNVAGITNTTSKKNVDMEMKVRQIQEEHDFKNIVFATGTPVSNSISELYTILSIKEITAIVA